MIPSCLFYKSVSLCLSAVYLCKRTMQNKARLELADYEAVSESGLFNVSTPLFTYLFCVQLFISCLFVHTDTENICYVMCHCIICNFPFNRAIKWITGLVILRVFFPFCMWAGIIKDGTQPCTVHITRSKHNQPRSLKSLFFLPFIVLCFTCRRA